MCTMKNIKIFILVFTLLFSIGAVSSQDATKPTFTYSVKRERYPQFSFAPTGGAIFPLTEAFRNEFKPGGLAGLDIGLKLNREVALFGHASYMFLSSKKTGAPVGQYMEFTAGPRYYFTHPKLKSQIYLEGGVGAYYFMQKSYFDPIDESGTIIDEVSTTRTGLNGGIGASLHLTKAVDILAKVKYHNVFTSTGSVGFMTINAGMEFTFR
jgi:opacity protein-like surface antigen